MKSEKVENALVVRPTQDDLMNPPMIVDQFQDWIEDGELRFVVDLSGIDYLSSLQLGALVSLHVLAYENVAMLKFSGLSPKLMELFKMLGIDQLMKMHTRGNVDVAVPTPAPKKSVP